MLRTLRHSIEQLPRPAIFFIGLLLVAGIWEVDRHIPPQVHMSIFYLLPICFTAWFGGAVPGYFISVLAAAALVEADSALTYAFANAAVHFWNGVAALGFFAIVTSLSGAVARLRAVNDREREAHNAAEEASRLKSRMLSLVSHEYGNALTTLKMVAALLEQSEARDETDLRWKCYATLRRVCFHLGTSTANYLNLHRLEAGAFRADLRKTPVLSIAADVLSMFKPLEKDAGVDLRLEVPDEPVHVRADPAALSLVLSNLLGNAIKYSQGKGAVTLSVVAKGDAVEIAVRDTGIGISEEDQERLCSPFFRSAPGKAVAAGYGIGLQVSRELLEAQGSRLALDSEPGKGSRFCFSFPIWKGSASPSPGGAAATRSAAVAAE